MNNDYFCVAKIKAEDTKKLLRLFKMIFIMKKKHRKRCFGIAVCKFKEFRYKIGIFRQ